VLFGQLEDKPWQHLGALQIGVNIPRCAPSIRAMGQRQRQQNTSGG